MQVVQSSMMNMTRKENRNPGSFGGEHGHCNRGLLCCCSRADRTTAWSILVNAPVWKPHTLFSQCIGWNQSQDSPYRQVAGESIQPQTSWSQYLPQRNGMILFWSIQIYLWNWLLGPYAIPFLSTKLCISAQTYPHVFFCVKAPVHSSGCEQVTSSSISWCSELNLASYTATQ